MVFRRWCFFSSDVEKVGGFCVVEKVVFFLVLLKTRGFSSVAGKVVFFLVLLRRWCVFLMLRRWGHFWCC